MIVKEKIALEMYEKQKREMEMEEAMEKRMEDGVSHPTLQSLELANMIHCHEMAMEIGKNAGLDLGEVFHGRQDMMLAFLRSQQEKEKEKGQEKEKEKEKKEKEKEKEDAETEKKKEKVEVSSSSGGVTVGWATIAPRDMTLEGQIKFFRDEKRRMSTKHSDTWIVERAWIERAWKERIRLFMGETRSAFDSVVRLADMEEAKEDEERRLQGKSVLTYQFGGAQEKEETEEEAATAVAAAYQFGGDEEDWQ
jgi:hypothetical protein